MKTTNNTTQFTHNLKPTSLVSKQSAERANLKSTPYPTSRRLPSCIFGLMLALCLCGAVPKANAIVFVNQGYGTCLDARDAYDKTGTPLDGAACNATFAQQWNFEGLEIQGIGSTKNAGYICVWATGEAGSGVVVAPCTYSKTGWNNQWYFHNNHVINVNNGLCIDVEGGPTTLVTLETCNGESTQAWAARN